MQGDQIEAYEFVLKELNDAQAHISTSCRFVAATVIGVMSGLVAIEQTSGFFAYELQRNLLLVSGALALLVVAIDLLQGLGRLRVFSQAFRRVQASKVDKFGLFEINWSYRLVSMSFNAKIVLALCSMLVLFVALVPSLYH